MFVIANRGTADVVLDDLRLVLGPGKEIDLDKVAPRTITESSEKLRTAVRLQLVRVVSKDADNHVVGLPRPAATSVDRKALVEMETRLSTKMAAKDQQIAELTSAVHALVKQLAEQGSRPQPTLPVVGGTPPPAEGPSTVRSTDDGLDDDIASKMHSLAVKRIEKKSKGNITQETTTVKDEGLSQQIDELEGLI